MKIEIESRETVGTKGSPYIRHSGAEPKPIP